jgi:VCBS repeat-containing protein
MKVSKLGGLAVWVLAAASLCVAQDVVSVVHGTVTKVDSATKTVVVKSADGTEHTIKFTADTTVKGTKEGIDGLAKGTVKGAKVTVYYTEESGKKVAHFFGF